MKLAIIFVFLIISQTAFSQSTPSAEKSLIEEWRPTIVKILGESFTEKLLGKAPVVVKPDEVPMPKIPVIKDDAKSSDVYNKKPDKVIMPKEEEEKYHYSFLEELYDATRMAVPSKEDFSKMMTVLSQGSTREGVYHALVLDATYAQLESIDKPVKDPAAQFAIYFYATYINKKITAESLKGMNMYSLKRLIAEKALDQFDAFGENREDLEKWYAVMSSDLATRFPQVWTGKLRKHTSKLIHKKWASKAPIQHIKSEVLIKIHKAFNSLM